MVYTPCEVEATCPHCDGSGISPLTSETCHVCDGNTTIAMIGKLTQANVHSVAALEFLDDILDKVNDIKEKVDEIKTVVDGL